MALADCRVCGAPNAVHREGCFNCGSLLRPDTGFDGAVLERQTLGDNDVPGRVQYAWKRPTGEAAVHWAGVARLAP
jgi:hypothetical protein